MTGEHTLTVASKSFDELRQRSDESGRGDEARNSGVLAPSGGSAGIFGWHAIMRHLDGKPVQLYICRNGGRYG